MQMNGENMCRYKQVKFRNHKICNIAELIEGHELISPKACSTKRVCVDGWISENDAVVEENTRYYGQVRVWIHEHNEGYWYSVYATSRTTVSHFIGNSMFGMAYKPVSKVTIEKTADC